MNTWCVFMIFACHKMNKILKASDTKGGYTPTEQEAAKKMFVPGKFKLSGDAVFHTIQWEWVFIGTPTTFIRLNNCNLACSWCDAWYTRKQDEKEYYNSQDITIDELYQKILEAQKEKWIAEMCRSITITGWEPLLQQRTIGDFIEKYWHEFTNIQIETNGTIPILDKRLEWCYYNCSPKLPSSNNDTRMAFRDAALKQLVASNKAIFKFVFLSPEDIDYVLETYKDIVPKDKMWFMPEWVTKEENVKVFETTIDHLLAKGVNVTVRAQNIMWDWAKRGV